MYEQRIEFYKKIEQERKSKVILYVTSDRINLTTQIGSDVLPLFVDHLDSIGDVDKISLILYTRGGDTLTAWTLVNLIRNFCKEFEVIVPFNCHSGGTLICLGANKIVMTKQATLGAIDPSINGPLNPMIPGGNPNARVPVSVEVIGAYLDMAKEKLGITDPAALAQILINLSNQIHPLTLGQVFRSKTQIQMLAEKLLNYQGINKEQKPGIIDFLSSGSGSHDYTIHRREAINIGLKVDKPNEKLYEIINGIYSDFKNEMKLSETYDSGVYLGQDQSKNYDFKRALVESLSYGSHVFVTRGTLSKQILPPQAGLGFQATAIQDNRTFEGWLHDKQTK